METYDVLMDGFERIRELVHESVEGTSDEALRARIDADANSIGWLVWHLTRVQDDHVSEIAGHEQAWVGDGWSARFGMDPDPSNTGYGHTSAEVASVAPEASELIEYYDSVHTRTVAYLKTIDAAELDRIIDRSYDPPVSVGVRLVSVLSDSLQHIGQAQYVMGILARGAGR